MLWLPNLIGDDVLIVEIDGAYDKWALDICFDKPGTFFKEV